MKRLMLVLIAIALLFSFTTLQADEVERSPEFWKMYSKNLVKCIKEGNEGVRYAALQRIVSYGDKLDVDAAVFDIMRIYRSDPNIHAKQLALSALNKMNNEWAIGFLKLQVDHEKNLALKKQIFAMIKQHEKSNM
ncbi:MAG: hypothetical protein H6696_01230 [Deferribacteres bacterium]|nr:hypothetical protein [candidate division KSB1 bacterium]MCB9500531.1 hypothetical protein [Deferribacteres bacterium]